VSITPVQKQVRVLVLRAGKQQALTVILSEKPDSEKRSPAPPVQRRDPAQPTGRRSTSPTLSVRPMSARMAAQAGYVPGQTGVLVTSLTISSTAEDSLQLYDVIEEAARVPVSSQEELKSVLHQYEWDEPVLLKIRRIENGTPRSRLIFSSTQALSEQADPLAF